MNEKFNKIVHKIFKKTLGIKWGHGDVLVISKSIIKDVEIKTVRRIFNDRVPIFESHIRIITTDDKVFKVNTNHIFVRYMPNDPQILGVDKYNRMLKNFIMCPFYDYELEFRPDTFFDNDNASA